MLNGEGSALGHHNLWGTLPPSIGLGLRAKVQGTVVNVASVVHGCLGVAVLGQAHVF